MSEIVIHRPHGLQLEKAKDVAEKIVRRLRDDFGGSYTWEGDSLRFRRTGASGQVAVTPDDIDIRVDIGLLLRPLRARIEREITALLDEHFGRTEPSDRAQPVRPAVRRSASTKSSRSHGTSRSERPK